MSKQRPKKNFSRNFAHTVVRCHQDGPSYQVWWLSDHLEGIYYLKHAFLTISHFPAIWRHDVERFDTRSEQIVIQEFPFDLLFWNLALCFIKGWTWFLCNKKYCACIACPGLPAKVAVVYPPLKGLSLSIGWGARPLMSLLLLDLFRVWTYFACNIMMNNGEVV